MEKKINNITFNNVEIKDEFFKYYQDLVIDEVIPYQWKVLNDELEGVEKSAAIRNFKIAAKEEDGKFYGFVFQDSDVYKWLEAVSYSLHLRKNRELQKCADDVIDLIGRAQEEDGYINTYFTIEKPELKFKNLWECHELYCAGHFFEAAVAYYNSTKKEKVIEIAKKFADCICNNFGPEEGKIQGYDGHQEIELGLMSLYSVTKEKRYLHLAKFFIEERGKNPYFFDKEWEERGKTSFWNSWNKCDSPSKDREYNQTHKRVFEQDEAVGHSVRVVYMLCGMADIAKETGDDELLKSCVRLWNNIVNKKMYLTGAIGSTATLEAFTGNYDLPNDSVYGETCASIGLTMFAKRMLNTKIDSKYSDIVEKEIFNGIISGIAMDGKSFFYVNPLEVYPKSHSNPRLSHVKVERQKWYPCACCPPNVARFLLNIGDYIYSEDDENNIYINQYIASKTTISMEDVDIDIDMNCNILRSKKIKLTVTSKEEKKYTLALRIPNFSDEFTLIIDGKEVKDYLSCKGYIYITRNFKNHIVELDLKTSVKLIRTSDKVRYNAGRIAVVYGPLVYCVEECDNGENLNNLMVLKDTKAKIESFKFNNLNLSKITLDGFREIDNNDSLYFEEKNIDLKEEKITLVPYHFWGNRTHGEMQVWLRVK